MEPCKSFQIFQSRVINEYEQMVPEYDLHLMQASLPIHQQQLLFRQKVGQLFWQSVC
jgi:hypothetical protein